MTMGPEDILLKQWVSHVCMHSSLGLHIGIQIMNSLQSFFSVVIMA